MAYQWYYNGIEIGNATNSILTVSNAQIFNQGFYQVSLTNDFGAATSQDIYLAGISLRAVGDFGSIVDYGSSRESSNVHCQHYRKCAADHPMV